MANHMFLEEKAVFTASPFAELFYNRENVISLLYLIKKHPKTW